MEKFAIGSGMCNIWWNILVWALEHFEGFLKIGGGNARLFLKKLKLSIGH